jgi:hypothetical protein
MKKKSRPEDIKGYSVWDLHQQFHRLEWDNGYFYGWENLSRDQDLVWAILQAIMRSPTKGEYHGFRWEEERELP